MTEPSRNEIELLAFREMWKDVRSYCSNIWQVTGLSLVVFAIFFDIYAGIIAI